MNDDLIERIDSLGRPRVLVVGDLILERDIVVDDERHGDEGPTPALRSKRREHRLAGAGRVAVMLHHLGADVRLISGLGDDSEATVVRDLLEASKIDDRLVVTLDDRPTPLRERFLAELRGRQPEVLFKVDHENSEPMPSAIELFLWHHLAEAVADSDIVLITDHDNGFCTPSLLRSLITACRSLGVRVIADPCRSSDLSKYEGVSALVPNRLEAQLATGMIIRSPIEALKAGHKLRDDLKLECAAVTVDRSGLALALEGGREILIPGRPREVFDNAGASEMLISVFGICLGAGADYEIAATLANLAGGLAVDKPGAPLLAREDLIRELDRFPSRRRNKNFSAESLVLEVARRRESGQQVVFTNGCFDLIHPGHVRLLREASAHGQFLIVGVNSDDSVRRLKGPSRPINTQEARVEVLDAIECVDAVVVFESDTPLSLIMAILPDVLVKGGDYSPEEVVGREEVEAAGGRLVIIPLFEGHSTTKMIHHATNRKLTLHAPSTSTPAPMSNRSKKPTEKKPKS